MLFKLMGHGRVFRAVRRWDVLGFIPTVHGISLDGRWQTTARVADVELVADVTLA